MPYTSDLSQRDRDIDRAKILLNEIKSNPNQEGAVGKELGYMSPDIQRAAQGPQQMAMNDLPSVEDANAQHMTQGNSEDLPSVQMANTQHAGLKLPDSNTSYGHMQDQEAGALISAGKAALSVPGFVGGLANAVSGIARGDKPSEALEGVLGSASDFGDKAFNTVLNMLPTETAKKIYELSQNNGAQHVADFLGKMFDMGPVGQGWGNIAAFLGANPEAAKQIDASIQLGMNMGLLAGNPRLGKEAPIDFAKERMRGYSPEGRQEPTLQAPEIDVQGAEPKLNDYEQLGIDNGNEPQMGMQPNMGGPNEPQLRTMPDIPGRQEPGPNLEPPYQAKPPVPQVNRTVQTDMFNPEHTEGMNPFMGPETQMAAPNGEHPFAIGRSAEHAAEESQTGGQLDMLGPTPQQMPSLPEKRIRTQPEEPLQFPLKNPKVRNFDKAIPDQSELHTAENDKEATSRTRDQVSKIAGESQSTFHTWVTTLPDEVSKDRVVQRHIKEIQSQMDYINTKLVEARDSGLSSIGSARGGVGRSKKSVAELKRLEKQIQNEQTILENQGKQLYERLKAKHPDTEPWFPQEGQSGKINLGEYTKVQTENGNVNIKSDSNTAKLQKGASAEPGGFRESTQHPFGKSQQGGIDFGDLGDRLKRGWNAMMEKEPHRMGQPLQEGGLDMLKRGWDEAKTPYEPQVYRQPLNRGPGGKQSGAVDFSIFDNLKSSEVEERLSRMWQQYHNLKDAGERLAGFGPNKNSKELAELKKGLNKLETISYQKFESELPTTTKAYVEREMHKIAVDVIDKFYEAQEKMEAQLKKQKDIDAQGGTAKILPFNKQSGAFDPNVFGEGLSKILGKGKTPAEIRKGLGYDSPEPGTVGAKTWHQFDPWQTKTAAEIIKEAEKRGSMEDISPKRESAIKDLFSGKTAAILTEHIPGSGEIIKWVNDKLRAIDRKTEAEVKQLLGFKYAETGTIHKWKTLIKDPNGIFSLWDERRTTKEDIAGMHDASLKAMFDGREAVREDFRNDTQYKMYQSIREGFNKSLSLVNETRKSIGLNPIEPIPGYLPTLIKGGYRLIGKDAMGNTKYLIGTDVRGKVNKWVVSGMSLFTEKPIALTEIKAELEKAHPDLTFSEIDLTKGDKTKLGDLSAFEETMRALSKNDPVAKAIHQTYIKILQSRGFGSHSLQRKGGWTGFQGSEKGYEGAKDMRNAIETWMNQSMQYRANIQKQGVYRELLQTKGLKWQTLKDEHGTNEAVPTPMIEKELPHTMRYLKDYVDHSMNKDLNAWDYLDSKILDLSHDFGFGRNYPTTVTNKLGNLASMFWLTTTRFLMSQGLQHMNFAPQMMKQIGAVDGVKAWAKGWEGFVMPDALQKRGIGWAVENGYLDAKIINAFDSGYDISTRMGNIKDGSDAFKFTRELAPKLSKYVLGKVEQELVRIPTFLWAEEALRTTVKDDMTRFARAAEMTDHYMVNYTKTERPMIYNRLGLAGVFLGKLKSYSHNFYGQFFEYLGDLQMNKPESVLPMSTFMANNLFQAGFKGLIGVEMINGAMNVLNWVNNTNWPTFEEVLYSSGMSDTFIYGGASKLTGLFMHHAYDFSSSNSAPSLGQMSSIPALEMAKAGIEGGKTIIDMIKGEATPGEKLTALKAALPSQAAGLVEKLYSPDGKMVPRTQGHDIVTDYTRDAEEWLVRKFIGTRSLDEAIKTAEMNLVNRKIEKDNQITNRMMSVMYDEWKNTGKIDAKSMEKFIYSEEKDDKGNRMMRGDPNRIEPAFVDKLKKEMLTRADRMIMKSSPNLPTVQRLQRLHQFGLLMDQSSKEDLLDMHHNLP